MRRPTVTLFGGWFGSRNAGDEAILLANLALFREVMPDARFVVHSIDPGYTQTLANVETVSTEGARTHLGKVLRLAKAYGSSDLFVITGGTPIFDFNLLSRAFHFGVPAMRRIPIVFYGIGVKPVRSMVGKALYRFFLRRAAIVSVRDPEVVDELRQLGFSGPVRLTADSAIALPRAPAGEADEILESAGLETGEYVVFTPIFLSVEDPNSHYHEPIDQQSCHRALAAMAAAADLCASRGLKVVMMAMHAVPPDDDRQAIREVVEMMSGATPVVLQTRDDPLIVTEVLARARCVVGMRLHSLVLATARAVPAVAVGFDMKVGGYMRYVGLGDFVRPISEIDSEWLTETVSRCLDERERISEELESTMAAWRDLLSSSADEVARLCSDT